MTRKLTRRHVLAAGAATMGGGGLILVRQLGARGARGAEDHACS